MYVYWCRLTVGYPYGSVFYELMGQQALFLLLTVCAGVTLLPQLMASTVQASNDQVGHQQFQTPHSRVYHLEKRDCKLHVCFRLAGR